MKVLVTGGAGFIGCHTAAGFAARGYAVTALDDMSRHPFQEHNASWLRAMGVEVVEADVRDADVLAGLVGRRRFDTIVHLAAQTAVTTSVADPRHDLEVNVLGTFNVLEAARRAGGDATVLYASTNKVYGGMEDAEVVDLGTSYSYVSHELLDGVPESRPISFATPYGCSKGAADQYVLDYAHVYGMRTASFRQSCIYGPRQLGSEDQGWVAWFTIAAVGGEPIVIYGDGKQVRDVLYVDDLVALYLRAAEEPDRCAGMAFNIGGGPKNTTSLLGLLDKLERLTDRSLEVRFEAWRPGDQRVYVSDPTLAREILGWTPHVSFAEGIGHLYRWVVENQALFVGRAAITGAR